MCVCQCVAEGVPIGASVYVVGGRRDGNRIGGDVKNEGDMIRAARLARGKMVVEVKGLSVCNGQVWSTCAIVREASGEVRP